MHHLNIEINLAMKINRLMGNYLCLLTFPSTQQQHNIWLLLIQPNFHFFLLLTRSFHHHHHQCDLMPILMLFKRTFSPFN